jgi:hypothetical protein
MYTSGAGNDSGDSTFVVSGSIEPDTPSSGFIRVIDTTDTTSARESRYQYDSWTGSTFSLHNGVTLDRTYTQTEDTVYVPFIDQQATDTSASVTVIYSAPRTILVRVRRYTATAILPFDTTDSIVS